MSLLKVDPQVPIYDCSKSLRSWEQRRGRRELLFENGWNVPPLRGKNLDLEISTNRRHHWLTLRVISELLRSPVMGSSWRDKRNLHPKICTWVVKIQEQLQQQRDFRGAMVCVHWNSKIVGSISDLFMSRYKPYNSRIGRLNRHMALCFKVLWNWEFQSSKQSLVLKTKKSSIQTNHIMKFRVFWFEAPCNHTKVDRRFRGAYCPHHQGMNYCDYTALHPRGL
jgi:hypothetical protein